MNPWVIVAIAGLMETGWALGLKYSEGFTRLWPSVVTIVLALGLWYLLRSPWGKAFTALRDNPIRAESLGVNVQAYTLLSFAIGAVYAGVAGALFAPLVEFIERG